MEVERAIARGGKRRQGRRIISSYGYFQVVFVQERDRIQVVTVKLR